MKKMKFILTMAVMTGMVAFAGCGKEASEAESENKDASAVTQEADEQQNTLAEENQSTEVTDNDSQQTSVPDIFTEADEDWNYVLLDNQEYAYLFELKYDETSYEEYATIVCQGMDGTYWTYETEKYEVGQYARVELLESTVNSININDGGTIVSLDITDGHILWENSDYQGSGSVCTMDENDNLYVAGTESPDLLVVDKNGKTLHRVGAFGDYFWPYAMSIENDTLTILFDCDDNAMVTVNINDYSYTIY